MISASIQAEQVFKTECPLSKKTKFRLIKNSRNWVDDIECVNNKYYKWYISNKSAIYPNFQIGNEIAKGKAKTHISKTSKIKREIASLQSKKPKTNRTKNPKKQNRIPAAKTFPEDSNEKALDKNDTGIFDFGIGYGGKFYSHGQSGALGSANVGALFLNNLSFFTSYEKRNFKLETEANTYKFKYDVNGSSSEKQLYSYSLRSFYQNFFLGITFEQQPLFKNGGNGVEMVAESSILPSLGYEWDIELSSKIETRLLLQTSVGYFLDSSASDPDIKISNHKGFSAEIKTRLTRRLNKSERFPIYYFWSNDLRYRDYERSVEWGTSSGSVKSEHLHFNSTVGLKIEF